MKDPTDIIAYNSAAWDREVQMENYHTRPVSAEVIQGARSGDWQVTLAQSRPVPRDWFPQRLQGVRILCLAAGGGQQGPVLAAAGAEVTVFDCSAAQLGQDRAVAEREGLALRLERGDMTDLSRFADGSFDLIVQPVANQFVPQVRPVWQECARVLRAGGELLAGFVNPVMFLFDPDQLQLGTLQVRWRVPYSDLDSLTEEERCRYMPNNEAMAFGHTLEDQLGGQMDAGLMLCGFYEERGTFPSPGEALLHERIPGYIVTRARKGAAR